MKADSMIVVKQSDCFEEVVIPVINVTEFTMERAADFSNYMRRLNSTDSVTDIFINICSYGGEFWPMISMLEETRNSPKNVHGICSGFCASAGAFLFSCIPGRRYISGNAYLMFHNIISGDHMSLPELEKEIKTVKTMTKTIFNLLCNRLARSGAKEPLNMTQFKKILKDKGDWHINSKDAIKHGFADEVGIPYFSRKAIVEVDMKK